MFFSNLEIIGPAICKARNRLFSIKQSLFSSFFWLDPKEPKGQDTAKLPPHKAGRWLAAVSSPAPIRIIFPCYTSERLGTHLPLFEICNLESTTVGFSIREFRLCCFSESSIGYQHILGQVSGFTYLLIFNKVSYVF